MRTDRLLSLLLLLQVNRPTTARQLAERLEVSERTILRDMNVLSGAGVPVVAKRGVGGGWSLLQPYRTDLTGLNTAEAQTLFLLRSSRLIADLGLGKAADAALIKLLAALPALARREVEFTRERLHIDGAGWYQSDEALPFLPVLQEAVWRERKVDMTYERADATTVDRQIDPLGLVAKGSLWYLVAAVEEEIRSYRVSRVRQAILTETACERPIGFDLAAFWEKSVVEFKAGVPRYPIGAYIAPELRERLRRSRYPRLEDETAPKEDGRYRVTLLFDGEGEALEFVLRNGTRIEVTEPIGLRRRISDTIASMATLYGDPMG